MSRMASIELIAEGQQDAYITGKPNVTYFDAIYLRHTPFIVETHEIPFDTTPRVNENAVSTLPYKGDVITDITLRSILPSLYTVPNDTYCYPVWPTDLATPIRLYVFVNGALQLAMQAASITSYWSTYNVGFWAGNFTGSGLLVSFNAASDSFVFTSSTYSAIYFIDETSASFWGFDVRNPDFRAGTAYGYSITGGSRTAQLNVTFSGWVPGFAPPTNANYYDGIGTRLVRSASLLIGGQHVSTITGDSIDLENDVSVPYENQMGLTALVGKNDTNYKLAPRYCFTELKFGIDKIPICALGRHDVQVEVEFESQDKLVAALNPGTGIQDSTSYTVADLRTVLNLPTYCPYRSTIKIYKDILFWDEINPTQTQRVFYDTKKAVNDPTAYTRFTKIAPAWGRPVGSYSYTTTYKSEYLTRLAITDFFANLNTPQTSTVKAWGAFGFGNVWTAAVPYSADGYGITVKTADARYVYMTAVVNYISTGGRSITMVSRGTGLTYTFVLKFYGATSIGATEYTDFITFWRVRDTSITAMTYVSQAANGANTDITFSVTSTISVDNGLYLSEIWLRYDTFGDFNNPASYSYYRDLRSLFNGKLLNNLVVSGSAERFIMYDSFDGRYIYNIYYDNYIAAYIVRLDTTNFSDDSGWQIVSLSSLSPQPKAAEGGPTFSDGQYIYLSQSFQDNSYISRLSIGGNLSTGWQHLLITNLPMQTIWQGRYNTFGKRPYWIPAAFDGRYVYYNSGGPDVAPTILYYDTTKPFSSASSWQWISKHWSPVTYPDDWTYYGTPSGTTTSRTATDSSGNYYVSGRLYPNGNIPIYNLNGTLYTTMTYAVPGNYTEYLIKYSAAGLVQWIVYLDEMDILNIVPDASGNVYLAIGTYVNDVGGSGPFVNANGTRTLRYPRNQVYRFKGIITKISSAGAFLWMNLIGIYPETPFDNARTWVQDIKVTGSGDVYSCGTLHAGGEGYVSGVTYSFFSNNNPTATTTKTPLGLYGDVFIMKTDSSGVIQWAAQAGSTNADDYGMCIDVDASGNPTVFGTFTGSPFTAYSSAGTAFATTLTRDNQANGFILRYNTTGGVLDLIKWTSSGYRQIHKFVKDGSGNNFITGVEVISGTYRIFLSKLNSAYVILWTAFTNANGTYKAVAPKLAIDSSENVYLSATSKATTLTLLNASGSTAYSFANTPDSYPYTDFYDAYVARYDNSTGAVTWALKIGGDRDEFPGGLAVDASGNLFLHLWYRTSFLNIYNTSGGVATTISKTESTGELSGASYFALLSFSSSGTFVQKTNMNLSYDNRFVTSSGNDLVGLEIANNKYFDFFQGLRQYYFIQGENYTNNPDYTTIFSFDPIVQTFTFSASVLVEYAYLGDRELEWFQKSRHNFLLEQKQVLAKTLTPGKTVLPLQFVGPVTDLWVTARTAANMNTYTYSNVASLALTLNGSELFNYDSVLFGLVEPFEVADNFPTRNMYIHHFSAPANFSRIRDKLLTVEIPAATGTVNVQVWAKTFNVLVVQNGLGGLMFNSYV